MGKLVNTKPLIALLRDNNCKLVVATAGGAATFGYDLLCRPGSTQYLLEWTALQDHASTKRYLKNWTPIQYTSSYAAMAMARHAYERGKDYFHDDNSEITGDSNIIGVGCACTLKSVGRRSATHRAFVAIHSDIASLEFSVTLDHERRESRTHEDVTVSKLLCDCVDYFVRAAVDAGPGITNSSPTAFSWDSARVRLQRNERTSIKLRTACASPDIMRLFLGQTDYYLERQTTKTFVEDMPKLIFSGSFNPIHPGHMKMMNVASQLTGLPLYHEICICNAAKPPLSYLDFYNRISGHTQLLKNDLMFTNRPLFYQKAQLFPNTTFMVGLDTLLRFVDPEFYGGVIYRDDAMDVFIENQCKLLVFGRRVDGKFKTIDDCDIPSEIREICQQVPKDAFSMDVTSSTLRKLT